ncbi:oxygen-insensitive NAD(P)H nitroreductase [Celerinatantimonas diazotrophica]|uniref:Dihydropteridine reductase n=1 Tax=Celerinatantimonas diazotrophica TaxID=412034 RepID=A0A4V2PNJ9_9GAMM|nr:oxygen-insensitive NAD(P)H nitroreductase [Celerinatantimonas diazotrophica]TCK47331.1 dihydropteridine reductase [Celerinatantimonas diazotrophica]CAG9295053.1 Oxygen-insensitive NAD(P)H nitroreductase [Celerinatantimonas diazotrophica]
MNPVDFASQRYTTKAYDSNKKIPAEQIEQLVESLRLAPSSVNSQPWHFVLASDDAGKQRIAAAGASGVAAYNASKINDASHVVVLCTRTNMDRVHLDAVLEKEQADGRYANDQARLKGHATRVGYVHQHIFKSKDLQSWMEKQTYIALGCLLTHAALLGIDATPMEGIDFAALDQELGLNERDLTSIVVVSLGYHSDKDFNAQLPKSRLSKEQVFDFI